MKIEKRSYSSSPWRLIDNNGREVYWQLPMNHPDLGARWVNEPVMGVTKAECTERVLELLGLCFARLNAGVAINPASGNPRPDEFGAAGLTLKQKQAANVWDHVDDALAVIELARTGRWVWMENPACKYIELRIDMRDGGCLIKDREGNRINPADLRKQLSGEQWEPWPAERMPLGEWQKQMARAAGAEPQAPNARVEGPP